MDGLWRIIELPDRSAVAIGRLPDDLCAICLRDKKGKFGKPFVVSQVQMTTIINMQANHYLGRPERPFSDLTRGHHG